MTVYSRFVLVSALLLTVNYGACARQLRSNKHKSTNNKSKSTNSNYDLRWSASGGGWRAMVANMGFANLFQHAGLLGNDSSSFTAISTNSGGSWFSTQFFYSPEFFAHVMGDADQLSEYVESWMNA